MLQRQSGSDSDSLRHYQMAFFIVPAIAEIEFEWRWTALLVKLHQPWLVMLFENLDRSDVVAEDANVPFIAVKIRQRDSGVVLHDRVAVIENEIADAVEPFFKHQVRGRF